MEKHIFTRADLSDIRVIVSIMCVPVEELLCQVVTGQILVPSTCCQVCTGAYDHVLLCQVLNVTAS
jgi:hypothetical protein